MTNGMIGGECGEVLASGEPLGLALSCPAAPPETTKHMTSGLIPYCIGRSEGAIFGLREHVLRVCCRIVATVRARVDEIYVQAS
jgi:hypothetical protein